MSTVHEGSCLCGHIRFRTEGTPTNVSSCHCRMCQKASGAAYLTMAEFPKEQLTWVEREPQWRASSDKAERGFCPKCGSPVSFRYAGSDDVDVAVTLYDHPESFPPTHDIFTESAQPWTKLDERLAHFPKERDVKSET